MTVPALADRSGAGLQLAVQQDLDDSLDAGLRLGPVAGEIIVGLVLRHVEHLLHLADEGWP
ncbi:hypothetical protein ABZ853_20145 [Streptomyces albidoflavus]